MDAGDKTLAEETILKGIRMHPTDSDLRKQLQAVQTVRRISFQSKARNAIIIRNEFE